MIPWLNARTLAYLAWASVNAGLIVQLGRQTQWGEQVDLPVPAIVEQTPGTIAVETVPDYRLPALKKNFTETLSRPLFVSSRREAPPEPPPPPPPQPTMKKGQFQLMGTVLVDDSRTAILKETAGGRLRQVVEGAVINGIKIVEVGADRVILSQYEETEQVRLKVQPSSRTAPQAPGLPQARLPVAGAQQHAETTPENSQNVIQDKAPTVRGRVLPRNRRVPQGVQAE